MQKPASKKTPESNTTVDKAKLAPEKSAPTTMKKYYREGKSHIEAFSILLIIPHIVMKIMQHVFLFWQNSKIQKKFRHSTWTIIIGYTLDGPMAFLTSNFLVF